MYGLLHPRNRLKLCPKRRPQKENLAVTLDGVADAVEMVPSHKRDEQLLQEDQRRRQLNSRLKGFAAWESIMSSAVMPAGPYMVHLHLQAPECVLRLTWDHCMMQAFSCSQSSVETHTPAE